MTLQQNSKYGQASLNDKNIGRSPHRSTDLAHNNNEEQDYTKRRKPKLNSIIPIQGFKSQAVQSMNGSNIGMSSQVESLPDDSNLSRMNINEIKLQLDAITPLNIDLKYINQTDIDLNMLSPLKKTDESGLNGTKKDQEGVQGMRYTINDKLQIMYHQIKNPKYQKHTKIGGIKNCIKLEKNSFRVCLIEDALSKTQIKNTNTLEDGLRQKLSRLHQITVQEEPFTYSLSKVHDRTFIHKILPCIQRQQLKHSPIGASNSKSPNLLRNTFSVEMYAEFLKFKNQQQQKQRAEQKRIKGVDELNQDSTRIDMSKKIKISITETKNEQKRQSTPRDSRDNIKILDLDQIQKAQEPAQTPRESISRRHSAAKSDISQLLSEIGMNFKEKMEFMMQKRKEEEKKKAMLEQIRKKKAQGQTLDMDFFTQLEQKDMDNRLIEIIMFEINKMFSKEMLKYRNVTSEYNSMLKRKNLLEAKLFKKRYEKVQKHLNGVPNMDSSLNPFKKQYQPSIFNTKMMDNKMDVPNNKELYENVIKEAFDDLADTDQEEGQSAEAVKEMGDKEIIERIRMKFRKRVIKEGPSIMNGATDQNTRFLEQMMNLCNFQRISNKIQGGINKFQRSHRLKNKSMSYNTSPRPEQNTNDDLDQTKSSFFITQTFMPMVSSSHRQTPTKQYHSSRFKTLHEQNNSSSPNVTNYLNYLASNHQSNISTKRINDYSTIQLNSNKSLNAQSSSRYGMTNVSRKNFQTLNPFQKNSPSPSRSLLRQVSKSTDLSPIITEVEKEIQIKDDIKEKARSKTLSIKDWEQIGQSRMLQFTILDRIIEDCTDYDRTNQDKLTKLRLGLNKTDSIEHAKHSNTMATTSRDSINKDTKKKNIEDTLTFLEKLKKMNKLSQVEKLNFE
ncbi:UNKNOWN [Stylonychia lemnae]|uniref:Uncharacterized protein n=1 Tax=Stylonychia lemnae TaxID=5949 RepID=A0A077ZS87_STYLE|nr:UNKNOWN [Stylonychia lemnae]|eukprot:CDW72235.1 UNKNOWN [Stylonychia lemnae]